MGHPSTFTGRPPAWHPGYAGAHVRVLGIRRRRQEERECVCQRVVHARADARANRRRGRVDETRHADLLPRPSPRKSVRQVGAVPASLAVVAEHNTTHTALMLMRLDWSSGVSPLPYRLDRLLV